MSSPLFIAEPQNGDGTGPILGASLAAYNAVTPMADLTTLGGEPVLVEEIAYCAEKFSTGDGMLLLAIEDGYGDRRLIGAYDIPAGTASLMATGRIKVDILIAAGYKLVAAHDVQDPLAAYASVDFVPFGGIVRAPGVLCGSALPAPDVSYRGKTFAVFGGAGVADAAYVCLKQSDDTYAWFETGVAP